MQPPSLRLTPWPEAEAAFRNDSRWRGGDDAYSITLGNNRHLWLFGDTLVLPDGVGTRHSAIFLNNSLAIQVGDDPASAEFVFAWGHDGDKRPRSFFLDHEPPIYLWPGDGVDIDGRALVFFMRVESDPGEPDPDEDSLATFRLRGWTARFIENLEEPPASWSITTPTLPDTGTFALGFAGVLQDGGFVYAHAIGDGDRDGTYVARWPVDDLARSDLARPDWWAGDRVGWTGDVADAVPTGLPRLTEFTVHRDGDRFLSVQMPGLQDARLEIRAAQEITGPWSDPFVWRPPLTEDPEVNIYAGKAHPDVGDEDGILITYASNGTTLATALARDDLYYPHCLRLCPA